MSKKEIDKICRKYQQRIQKIVDDSKNITKITMQIGGKPPVVIAEKKEEAEPEGAV